jgi:hypothetical protein
MENSESKLPTAYFIWKEMLLLIQIIAGPSGREVWDVGLYRLNAEIMGLNPA